MDQTGCRTPLREDVCPRMSLRVLQLTIVGARDAAITHIKDTMNNPQAP